ncbi:class I SAM-dependent methyltransferase [Rhodococcus gannanensis]|uniref:Class I SAM-dependent methyltransferase n=1 Tax=Rhodococcus gannanensis TaxID=1960308 RepID=A0ABW4P6Y0_9NOCA
MEHSHAHARDHAHGHGHGHGHGQGQPDVATLEGLAEVLDLDAEVLGSCLDDITDWVAGHASAPVRSVVDIGAGTGTGTVALARRFDGADLIAIDRWPTMIDRLRATAAAHGLDGRLRIVEADLDAAWPSDARGVDVAWASASLHEVADPDRLLRGVRDALTPDGVLAVVEMDSLPRFLPDAVGEGLESRCHETLTAQGWNSYPDWRGHLERAGFEVVDQRSFEVVRPASEPVRRYARLNVERMRGALADRLGDGDLRVLDDLLTDGHPDSLMRRDDLTARVGRTGWVARA